MKKILLLIFLFLLTGCSTVGYQKFMYGPKYIPMDNTMILNLHPYTFVIKEEDFFDNEVIEFCIETGIYSSVYPAAHSSFAISADGIKPLGYPGYTLKKINWSWYCLLEPDYIWGRIEIIKTKKKGF